MSDYSNWLMEELSKQFDKAKAEAYWSGLEDGRSDSLSLHMYKADCEKLTCILTDLIKAMRDVTKCIAGPSYSEASDALYRAEARLALVDVKYEVAVNRDNALTQAELVPYIEGLMWAEERGLR